MKPLEDATRVAAAAAGRVIVRAWGSMVPRSCVVTMPSGACTWTPMVSPLRLCLETALALSVRRP